MFEVSILITQTFIEQIAIFSNIKTPVFYPTNATINVYHRYVNFKNSYLGFLAHLLFYRLEVTRKLYFMQILEYNLNVELQ